MIDKERIARQFVKLVSIDAPSYREREMAAQHHADIDFGKRGDPLLPEQLHSASVPVDHVQDQLNGRALARAVLTDQPADCAAGQFQINGPQRKIRVMLFKAVQF